MSLKISHIDASSVRGIIDGSFEFSLVKTRNSLTAKIAGWKRTQEHCGDLSAGSMRSSAYEMVARYRESQKTLMAQ